MHAAGAGRTESIIRSLAVLPVSVDLSAQRTWGFGLRSTQNRLGLVPQDQLRAQSVRGSSFQRGESSPKDV